MTKAVFAFAAALSLAFPSVAATWRSLDDASCCSAAKASADSLVGKVVLVDCWGPDHASSRAQQGRVEQIWRSFSSKPFVVLGSIRGAATVEEAAAAVKAEKLTFPTYLGAGIDGEPAFSAMPFFYVVNHRGRVVYSGASERDATEALVTAIGQVGGPVSLTGGVLLKKYRSLEKQLVLGKPVKNIVRRLEEDVRKAGGKIATKVQKEKAVEARELLAAIDAAKRDAMEDIGIMRASDPEGAVRLIGDFSKSFPDEAAEYKDALPELNRLAEERRKARKAEQEAAKAAAKKRK